ncbi:DUF1156 domain-containing protein [Nocardioides sp. CFH 31398]|uniref:DUF1156 domain-containing protein n=1 Tax=Nocardioides sp. CFH 31398 TaxID=2919579 RepID=UPI001F06BB7D|nr:DUF1156 domain-containing protein [Nocardioides sp. CFH 31398]MCH1867432.1 DUF1156 domain-containing protein [Nocardioides sp. CFH 31398]
MHKRKLIEVALPLEAINRAAAAEKARKVGKPQQIHHWWARRPITAARAMLFAQLVNDPSSAPERFPDEASQRAERERLHSLLADLAAWDAIGNPQLLAAAACEIRNSNNGFVPKVLDPFAGGGAIPLEAQRLGAETVASDLNPVAVLLVRCLIEIPAKHNSSAPVYPGLAESRMGAWTGSQGLAADVRAYGEWMRKEAHSRIGHLYPDAAGMRVVSWIWARTVTCPNPACGMAMPLAKSWWLSKKAGKQAYLTYRLESDSDGTTTVRFSVAKGAGSPPSVDVVGTMTSTGATCIACGSAVSFAYLREEASAGRMGARLLAIVAEGDRKRVYLDPDPEHEKIAREVVAPEAAHAELPKQALGFRVQAYGLRRWADLFTSRQLLALSTLADLVAEARNRVIRDGGHPDYADAVATYLGLVVSRLSDWSGSLCRWEPVGQVSQQVFGKQTVNMTWDFSETSALAPSSVGSFGACLSTVLRSLEQLGGAAPAIVTQANAAEREYVGLVINTDPPYYDNIGYSDLADYFYVWLRRSLGSVHPDLFGTMLVPKAEELVANPFRHEGKDGAKSFFESGFRKVFTKVRESADDQFPIVVYYAFKQAETSKSGTASTGWETLLEGMIDSGWSITGTWPVRSEMTTRMRGQGANALASSIVLSLRPRPEGSLSIDRRGFIATLEAELPDALRRLQQGQVAPVDLPQAAIGPGMAVFSRYDAVLEPDGSRMSVRSALARINEILDRVLNEQEGEFDPTSRFAIAWYRLNGYGVGDFGDANNLANARNTSVEAMDRDEILISRAGNVQLVKPADLPRDYDVLKDAHTSNWEALHHLIRVLGRDGIAPAGDFLQAALTRPDGAVDADLVKELAHLLFRIAEGNGWTKDALSFNNLVTSWPEILEVARSVKKLAAEQGAFDFDEGDE